MFTYRDVSFTSYLIRLHGTGQTNVDGPATAVMRPGHAWHSDRADVVTPCYKQIPPENEPIQFDCLLLG